MAAAEKTKEQETTEERKPIEINFTEKQLARHNKLQVEMRIAQAVAQSHIDGLAEEYELDQKKQWTLGPKGFVEVLPPDRKGKTPPSGDSSDNGSQGDSGESSGEQTPPADAGEEQTPTAT